MMEKELIDGAEDFGAISDINVTPFIDIMLVLLIIFMVTAPLMLGGVHVNLPKSGGDPMPRPENPAIVSLDAQSRVYLDKEELPLAGRHEKFQELARESATGEVFVRGDGEVKYGRMMELMAELGQAGFARVTLVTDIRLRPEVVERTNAETPPISEASPATKEALSADQGAVGP
jgi:biopolymer transport protein TolR